MREEAGQAASYTSAWGKHPRMQILTIKELLDDKKIDYPQTAGMNVTFKPAPKAQEPTPEQSSFGFENG